MKTIQIEKFGGPEVLVAKDAPQPQPAAGQVRVRLKAVGVNPFESKVRAGAMEPFFKTALPTILGNEIAGVVDAVGAGVSDLAVGDEVFGWSDSGSYAEWAVASMVAKKPGELSFTEAASLPVAGETAQRVLDLLAVKSGDVLLIHGGAGVVGSAAVQLAQLRGAKVVATASAATQSEVSALGATPVVYGAGLTERVRALGLPARADAPLGIDAVFDAAGKGALPDSIAIRGGKSRIVTIADPAAGELGIVFSSGTAKDRSVALLVDVGRWAAAKQLTVKLAAEFPLAEAAAAQRLGDGPHAPGKIVLRVD